MDKSKWPQGPWIDEPDEDAFEHAGLQCRIFRTGSMGHLCGYVQVPEGHPLHGLGYSDAVPEGLRAAVEAAKNGPIGKRGVMALICTDFDAPSIDLLFDVHGSLTYSGDLRGFPGTHWYGFDCAHAGDLTPGSRPGISFDDDEYRDIEYVRGQCRSLADQLAALAVPA